MTGGSRGIGAACARTLARMDYHVLINYLSNQVAAKKVKAEIEADGGQASLIQFDVGDRQQCRQALEDWMTANDQMIEVLVNNAGMRKDNTLVWMADDEWDAVINTHLAGFYNVTKAVVQPMILKKYGRIINVVSLSGLKGLPGQTNYSAAKAGVIGATKALAQELAKRKITVNCVAPGFIRTDMTADLDEKELKNLIPMRRFGTPEEVAHCVAFLASPQAAYITGEVISLNGGLYT